MTLPDLPPLQCHQVNRERGADEFVHIGGPQAAVDVQLMFTRRDNLQRRCAQIRSRGRVPRVCLYALCADGQEPTHSLEVARAYALCQGWQVGAAQAYTDPHDAGGPLSRSGWIAVRRRVRAGYADGVVVLTRFVISSRLHEYEQQLDWFERHFGFVALVEPESSSGPS